MGADGGHLILSNRVKQHYLQGLLQFIPAFETFLASQQTSLESTLAPFDLSPYPNELQYEGNCILLVSNRGLRQMYTRDFPLVKFPGTSNPTTESMKAFINSPMQGPVRNLLYRLIHNKLAFKDNISYILNLPDNRCIYCGLKQTTMHMLFTCHTNQDVWRNFLNLFYHSAGPFDLTRLYQNFTLLHFQEYQLLDSYLRVNNLEVLSSLVYSIWRAYWRHHFDSTPIDDQLILSFQPHVQKVSHPETSHYSIHLIFFLMSLFLI